MTRRSESSRRAKRRATRGGHTSKGVKVARRNVELTKEQRAELAAVVSLPDEAIDMTDAPEVGDWTSAAVGRFYRPVKQSVTMRIDADVLDWLRSHGPGYQTRVNRLLRSVMEHQRKRRRSRV